MLLDLLILQVILGAFDTLYHHELTEQLPYRRGASLELRIHGMRELLYAPIVIGLAWFEWHGWFALLIAAIFVIEIGLTLWDFVVEDRTRKLPVSERITHTILAINGGVFLALLGATLLGWYAQPGAVEFVDNGWRAWFLSAACVGLVVWGVRDLHAARKLGAVNRGLAGINFGATRLHVLVSGATGFIGKRLVWSLLDAGHSVTVLARNPARAWMLFDGKVSVCGDLRELNPDCTFDALINLAGAPVVGLPWSKSRKALLLESRLTTTRELLDFIARASIKPRILISASAVGFYGNRGDSPVTERDPGQAIFVSQLCQAWEQLASQAESCGVRVCTVRLGLVLGWGGAFPLLIAPYLAGLGARFGDGRQWVSWVHVDDVIAAMAFLMRHPLARGPYNVVAPGALAQCDMARVIAQVYHRPQWIAVPRRIMEGVLGEMAELFTRGQRVSPARLCEAGFKFRFPEFAAALRQVKQSA